MAKKDITITMDINSVGSRSQQKVEREKALAALEKAKKQNRPVVFVKPGDGEFRRKLEKLGEVVEMLCTGKASAYIGISNYAFTRRMTALNIPHVRKGTSRYFKVTDLDHYKEQLLNVQ